MSHGPAVGLGNVSGGSQGLNRKQHQHSLIILLCSLYVFSKSCWATVIFYDFSEP